MMKELILLTIVVLLVKLYAGEMVETPGGYKLNDEVDLQRARRKKFFELETQEMVALHGYPVESHVVTTDDGYILKLHRIPRGRSDSDEVRPPVLLMHGLLAASDLWTMGGLDNGPAFILADSGYDVWMGNARGNCYSRRHVTLSPKDPEFWHFSWHEMGNNDLPAVIDYILDTTGQQQLYYIGHSMGTSMYFALMSTQPEYNDKIRLMVALAPAAYLDRISASLLKIVRPFIGIIVDGIIKSGDLELFPRTRSTSKILGTVCSDVRIGRELCSLLYFSAFGYDRKLLNTTLLPTFWTHLTSGISVQTLDHYNQIINTKRFQMYDRTRKGRTMPLYDLSKISSPVSLHYALNDGIVDPDSVVRLGKALPNLVALTQHPIATANHMDPVLTIQAKKLVFDDVMRIKKMY